MGFIQNQQITWAGYAALNLAILGVLLIGSALGQTSQADNPDWALRSSEIHWPARFTPADAALRSSLMTFH